MQSSLKMMTQVGRMVKKAYGIPGFSRPGTEWSPVRGKELQRHVPNVQDVGKSKFGVLCTVVVALLTEGPERAQKHL